MWQIEWLDESDDADFSEPAYYIVDANGIVAGPFDDEGEAMWWIDKSKRI